ncbi:rubrerythrin-like domain-containing protein [Haladaptatus sp. DJG-WS-42]
MTQTFECMDCGHRMETTAGTACPECGGVMQNLTVRRE